MSTLIQPLAHRGLWREPAEQNSFVALARALDAGMGIETDIRDHDQDLVISHDPPTGQCWPLTSLLEYYVSAQRDAWLAFNIKADGLASALQSQLNEFAVTKYFVFDMSIPDLRHYARLKARFFSRQSELEPQPVLYEECAGVWLDAFQSEWYDPQVVETHLDNGKDVAIVSPELHGRPHHGAWERLFRLAIPSTARVLLCTDQPTQLLEVQGI